MTTIFLRWISPDTLLKAYQEDLCLSLEEPQVLPQKLALQTSLFTDSRFTNNERIMMKINYHNSVKLFTHRDYEIINYFTDHHTYKPEGKCLWCLRTSQRRPFGLPVDYKEVFFTNKEGETKIINLIYCVKRYCSMRCVYADYLRISNQKNVPLLYRSSEEIIFLLHRLFLNLHSLPYRELKPAPDFSLLDENGGPLRAEEFDSETYSFVEMPFTYFFPVSTIYEIVEKKN
jgi:hypothetical protein